MGGAFSCQLCDNNFSTKDILQKHFDREHKGIQYNDADHMRICCRICNNEEFPDTKTFLKHARALKHDGVTAHAEERGSETAEGPAPKRLRLDHGNESISTPALAPSNSNSPVAENSQDGRRAIGSEGQSGNLAPSLEDQRSMEPGTSGSGNQTKRLRGAQTGPSGSGRPIEEHRDQHLFPNPSNTDDDSKYIPVAPPLSFDEYLLESGPLQEAPSS